MLRPLDRFKRVPSERWFALIGSIDADDARAFPIGAGREWVAPDAGVLTCFANDVPWAYLNNRGTVDLSVLRVT